MFSLKSEKSMSTKSAKRQENKKTEKYGIPTQIQLVYGEKKEAKNRELRISIPKECSKLALE